MAVYAEWNWSCELCGEQGEEPWGDPQDAERDMDAHAREVHPDSGPHEA